MDRHLALMRLPQELSAFLLSAFGVLALVLAAVGLYGVVSYGVSQRTPEIGIRMALGADGPRVVRLLVASGLKLVVIGGALGVCAVGIRRNESCRSVCAMMLGVKAYSAGRRAGDSRPSGDVNGKFGRTTLQPPRFAPDSRSLEAGRPRLYGAIRGCRRLAFNARHTKSHSPRTLASPRWLKRRKPSTCLIQPYGASDNHFRSAYTARPAGVDSFSTMRPVAGCFFRLRAATFLSSRPVATYPSTPRFCGAARKLLKKSGLPTYLASLPR